MLLFCLNKWDHYRLTSIFNSNISKANALRRINKWIKQTETKKIKEFSTFVKTPNKYKTFITNYFKARSNSALSYLCKITIFQLFVKIRNCLLLTVY